MVAWTTMAPLTTKRSRQITSVKRLLGLTDDWWNPLIEEYLKHFTVKWAADCMGSEAALKDLARLRAQGKRW